MGETVYTLTAHKAATKFIASQDEKTQRLIAAKLQRIKEDPFDAQHSKQLMGVDYRAARVGGLRIVFSVNRETKSIEIEKIDTRGQVYRRI